MASALNLGHFAPGILVLTENYWEGTGLLLRCQYWRGGRDGLKKFRLGGAARLMSEIFGWEPSHIINTGEGELRKKRKDI